jgi:two-component system sensor histidine kinase RpfC
VTDTGIGVPMAVRHKLFEAFEQADASLARRYGGTGLGTTIAKGLTEAMGGRIGFESIENRGSRFWVELPFHRVAPLATVDGELPSRSHSESPLDAEHETSGTENVIAFSDPFRRHRARVRSLRVLVADDHAANRMVLQRLLEKAGHQVICVDDGEGVLGALEVTDYDAVIADLHMPGLSGLDMLRQLRVMEAGGGPRTPVVMFSADVTPESIRACEQAGARAFLSKPISTKRLLDTLSEIAASMGVPVAHEVPSQQPAATAGRTATGDGTDVLDGGVLDELCELGMGDNFEREFISQCLRDAEDCYSALAEAGARRDWEPVREQAHALKGVASNLGLIQLAAASGELMRLPEWQLGSEWRQRLAGIGEQVSRGRAALEARERRKRARDNDERSPERPG